MLYQYGEKLECQVTSYPSRQQEELESLLHYKKALEDELIRQINQQEYAHCSSVVQGILERRIGQLKQDTKSPFYKRLRSQGKVAKVVMPPI